MSLDMKNNTLSKNSRAFGLSLAVTSVVNALLVIAKETSPAIEAAMKNLTGHHWITHSLAIVLLFLALGWILARTGGNTLNVNKLIRALAGGVILGSLIIVGFYLFVD